MSVFQGLCPCLTRSPARSVARLLRALFVDIGSVRAGQVRRAVGLVLRAPKPAERRFWASFLFSSRM
jgi:hypothetical protein